MEIFTWCIIDFFLPVFSGKKLSWKYFRVYWFLSRNLTKWHLVGSALLVHIVFLAHEFPITYFWCIIWQNFCVTVFKYRWTLVNYSANLIRIFINIQCMYYVSGGKIYNLLVEWLHLRCETSHNQCLSPFSSLNTKRVYVISFLRLSRECYSFEFTVCSCYC